jgi:hypothetical protein
MGMRSPIDVAVLHRDGVVLRTATLPPVVGYDVARPRAGVTVEI